MSKVTIESSESFRSKSKHKKDPNKPLDGANKASTNGKHRTDQGESVIPASIPPSSNDRVLPPLDPSPRETWDGKATPRGEMVLDSREQLRQLLLTVKA